MRNYVFLDKPAGFPVPSEYARFTQRRALWTECGMTPDNTTHEEWQQAATFIGLERKYAQREQKKS